MSLNKIIEIREKKKLNFDVSPEMERQIIERLKEENIKFSPWIRKVIERELNRKPRR